MAKKFLITGALVALLAASAKGQTPAPTPKPKPTPWPNKPPSVKLVSSADRVVLLSGCAEGTPTAPVCKATSPKVVLRARATDPDGDSLFYTYSTTGGRLTGDGAEVTFDLTGVAPGTYTISVEVDDGNGGISTDAVRITVERCTCPLPPPPRATSPRTSPSSPTPSAGHR